MGIITGCRIGGGRLSILDCHMTDPGLFGHRNGLLFCMCILAMVKRVDGVGCMDGRVGPGVHARGLSRARSSSF
jgi:hypothetical protein